MPTREDAIALGLTGPEYDEVCEKLGRDPNQVELAQGRGGAIAAFAPALLPAQTTLDALAKLVGLSREAMLARYAPTAEVMLEVLDRLVERHRGVDGYLAAAGVPQANLDRLRDRLLAPGPGARQPGL